MAVEEQSRHDLHQRLDQVLGPEDATRLIERRPPVAWTDIATKQDIELLRTHDLALLQRDVELLRTHDLVALEDRMTLRLAAAMATLRAELAELKAEMRANTRGLFFAVAGLMITLVFAIRVT